MVLKNEDRVEIMKAVKVALKQIYGTQKDYERSNLLITAEELSKRFPCFSKDWLQRFGYLLPRERVNKWEDETCLDRWGYRWYEIQRGIHEGRYSFLSPFIEKP